MVTYRIQTPPHIILGRDVMATIAREQRRTDLRRTLLITEAELFDSGKTAAITSAFEDAGLSVATFTGFDSGAVSSAAEAALELSRSGFIQSVIGFGSASTVHLGRIVAALVNVETPGVDENLDRSRIDSPGVPFLAVPSAPFDPLICSPRALVVDARNRHLRIVELEVPAAYVIYDSALLETTTKMQGLYALAASMLLSIEGLVSRGHNPISDPLHERVVVDAVRLFSESADAALAPTDQFQESIRRVALLSAIGASTTGLGIGSLAAGCLHAQSGLGLTAPVPALAGPAVSRLVAAYPEHSSRIAELLGTGDQDVEVRVRELLGGAGLPLRLKEIGIDKRDLPNVVDNLEAVASTGHYSSPVTVEELSAMIDAAL